MFFFLRVQRIKCQFSGKKQFICRSRCEIVLFPAVGAAVVVAFFSLVTVLFDLCVNACVSKANVFVAHFLTFNCGLCMCSISILWNRLCYRNAFNSCYFAQSISSARYVQRERQRKREGEREGETHTTAAINGFHYAVVRLTYSDPITLHRQKDTHTHKQSLAYLFRGNVIYYSVLPKITLSQAQENTLISFLKP